MFKLNLPSVCNILLLLSGLFHMVSTALWALDNEECQGCHFEEWQEWTGSHHDKAMQKATGKNVLGDFDNKEITVKDVATRFYRKGDEFWVNTENEKGISQEYRVEYTFGFTPLQQYLIKTEKGKYQVLPLSWDSRPLSRGGQRWFHIYGDEHIPHNDRLHWTQPLQNWNGMCADCHATGLKRNYNPAADQFDSVWSNINVACISCHGMEKRHGDDKSGADVASHISRKSEAGWVLAGGENTVHWQGAKRDQAQVGLCAACHARRTPLTDGFNAGDKFLDAFLPTLITPPDYYPDGQIRGEVYVWGSFLQSKMYGKGVICSDCHMPHSLKLKAEGNKLCGQCHRLQYFDSPKHNHHRQDSKGAQCVNCHMTSRTYMQVDGRRDHDFRIPRPDISIETGSPDACTSCHNDKDTVWAQKKVTEWFGKKYPIHYGEVMNDVFNGVPGAEKKLKMLLRDTDIPVVIRASGYSFLVNYPNEDSLEYVRTGLNSAEALIRLGAVRASVFIPMGHRKILLEPLLSDSLRVIRIEAVRALGRVDAKKPGTKFARAYRAAEGELLEADMQTSWRGEGRVNLGLFYQMRGEDDKAMDQYLAGLRIDPYFPANYINLADLFRGQGKDSKGEQTISTGLSKVPHDPDLNFSMALFLVRKGKISDALSYFEKATAFAPENSYYAYVYSIALNEAGQKAKAIDILEKAVDTSPNDRYLNSSLLRLYRSQKDFVRALKYAEKLNSLFPEDKQIHQQIEMLKQYITDQK